MVKTPFPVAGLLAMFQSMKSNCARVVRVAFLLALWSGALLVGCATKPGATKPRTLRVMTFNIHHAEGLDGKVDLDRIARLIKEQKADLVGLQEVDRGVERTQRRDLPAELAALTGMTCLFSNNYSFQGGEYGNAVLTKWPVKGWTNFHFQLLEPGESRGMLQVALKVRGRELIFLNTHLDHRTDDSERWSSSGEIVELLKPFASSPVVMVGDFNDHPESRVCRRIAQQLDDSWDLVGQGSGFTIPSSAPRKRIDFIWISRDKSLIPLRVWVPATAASDHRPVVADLEFR